MSPKQRIALLAFVLIAPWFPIIPGFGGVIVAGMLALAAAFFVME